MRTLVTIGVALLGAGCAESPSPPRIPGPADLDRLKAESAALVAELSARPVVTDRRELHGQTAAHRTDRERAADIAILIAQNPRLMGLRSELGAIYTRAGLGPEAREHLLFALRQEPDRSETLRWLGVSLLQDGEPGIGRTLLETAAVLAPRDPHPWRYLGLLALQDGHREVARRCFRTCTDLAARSALRGDVLSLYQLGLLAEEDGDMTKALELFRRATMVDRDHLGATHRIAALLQMRGDVQEAAEARARHARLAALDDMGLLGSTPERVRALQLAILYLSSERFEEALVEARDARRRAPDDPQAWAAEIRARHATGGVGQARRLLADALDRWPEEPILLDTVDVLDDQESGG